MQQRDSYFHGWIYRTFIDPRLLPLRKQVGSWVPEGSSVVDVGCGTGAQLFSLSDRIERGLGIDLSRSQIHHARNEANRLGHAHLKFQAADATRLESIATREFSIGVASMVVHEMHMEIRVPLLEELRRIATTLILVDWAVPQPTFWLKIGTHTIERLAGREHYRGFCSFNRNGGIPTLLQKMGLHIENEQDTAKGTIHLWRCA